jgi:hypothetical protein
MVRQEKQARNAQRFETDMKTGNYTSNEEGITKIKFPVTTACIKTL